MLNAIFFDMFDENALSQSGQVNHHGNSFIETALKIAFKALLLNAAASF